MTEFINLFLPFPTWAVWTIRSLSGIIIGLLVYFGRNYFIEAKKFRNTIYSELEGLYPTPTKWPEFSIAIEVILREKYPRIEIAVHTFRGHLPSFLLSGFDNAWLQYHKNYYQYMPFEGVSVINGKEIRYDNTKTYKETFKKNVDRLLKYAKQI